MNAPIRPSMEDIFFLLWKWKWSLLTIICVTMFCTGVWVFLANEDVYTAEAILLVKPGVEQSVSSTVQDKPMATVGYRSADVKSECDILQSTDLLNIVIDKYSLDKPQPQPAPKGLLKTIKFRMKAAVTGVRDAVDNLYIAAGLRERLTPREKTLAGLRRGLSAKPVEGANSIVADLTLPFRKGSGDVLNALIDEYMKFRVAIYRNRGNEYFRTAMEQSSANLTKAETAKNAFERERNIGGQEQQRTLLLQQQADLATIRRQAEIEYKVAQDRFDQLGRETARANPNFGSLGDFDSSPFQRGLLVDIANLQKNREEKLLTEIDGSAKLKNLDDQIRILVDTLKANVESVRNERKTRLDAAIAHEAGVQGKLDEIHNSEVHLTDLQRQTQALGGEYDEFRRKYNESNASRTALEQQVDENIAVLEHATDPIQPSGMRKTMAMGLAFAAALIVGLAYITIGEYLDHRVYMPGETESRTGAPVIAIVQQRNDFRDTGTGGLA